MVQISSLVSLKLQQSSNLNDFQKYLISILLFQNPCQRYNHKISALVTSSTCLSNYFSPWLSFSKQWYPACISFHIQCSFLKHYPTSHRHSLQLFSYFNHYHNCIIHTGKVQSSISFRMFISTLSINSHHTNKEFSNNHRYMILSHLKWNSTWNYSLSPPLF